MATQSQSCPTAGGSESQIRGMNQTDSLVSNREMSFPHMGNATVGNVSKCPTAGECIMKTPAYTIDAYRERAVAKCQYK